MKNKIKIAIFASGSGSNAKAIIDYSKNSNYIVSLIVSNKENAGVLKHAETNNIDILIIDKENFYHGNSIISFLKDREVELIVLAGFLWKIPNYLIDAFENRILNIHPSLLPKYGGKGMYGINVHNAVFENKDTESGITIHLVNKEYDKGKILFQKKIDISNEKNPNGIAKSVLKIEHKFYPKVIDTFIKDNNNTH